MPARHRRSLGGQPELPIPRLQRDGDMVARQASGGEAVADDGQILVVECATGELLAQSGDVGVDGAVAFWPDGLGADAALP